LIRQILLGRERIPVDIEPRRIERANAFVAPGRRADRHAAVAVPGGMNRSGYIVNELEVKRALPYKRAPFVGATESVADDDAKRGVLLVKYLEDAVG
jgi:hypothetical protein